MAGSISQPNLNTDDVSTTNSTAASGSPTSPYLYLTHPLGARGGAHSPRHGENSQSHTDQGNSNQSVQRDALGISSPPAKKRKTGDTDQAQTSISTSPFNKLPDDVTIDIFEHLPGDTLLALWRASLDIYQVFYHPHGLKLWNEVRLASGLAPALASEPPTRDELLVMFYVLDDFCELCKSGGASHQWPWGIRRCGRCLVPSLVTRSKFIETHGERFNLKRAAFEAIGWYNPIDMPGLDLNPMATNFINAAPEDRGHFVASRRLASFAVQTVERLEREQPKKSQRWMDNEAKDLILSAQSPLKYLLDPIQERLENGDLELDYLGTKREQRVIDRLFEMKSLKIHKHDIPSTTDFEWRSLACKGAELTAREWHTIKAPLARLVKTQQTRRFLAMLEDHPPPTPASLEVPVYSNLESVASVMIGVFPAGVFLKICANADLDTIAAIEKSSKLVRNVLKSRAADPTWRAIKTALGLNTCFDHWPERAFLAYAVRRRCSYCPQEGLNIPSASLILCGDCFESSVIEIKKTFNDLPQNVVKSIAYIQSGPFRSSGWINVSKKTEKLYQSTYIASLTRWMRGLPPAVKTSAPEGLIAKHVASHTDSFTKIAKICETWQKTRDPRNVRLIDRRGQAILKQAARDQHVLGIPGHVFQSEEWKKAAEKAYPLSEKEWNRMKGPVLQMLRKDQILGGVRMANIR